MLVPMKKIGLFLKILVILMVFSLADSSRTALAQSGAEASWVLDNGLKVIAVQQPGNTTVSSHLVIKAGSASENGEKEYGLAHLMEHMAFKGTLKRGVGEVSAEVENKGGSINAYTSYDLTVYHLTMPAESLETCLDILSDIVFSPAYDPQEYLLEKEVVVEEISRAKDNPDHVFWQTSVEAILPGHPYAHPVLGYPETVREATRETALAFHDKFYRPDNALLIISGGFDPADIEPLLTKYFQDLKNPFEPLVKNEISIPGDKPGLKILTVKHEMAQVPKTLATFRIPAFDFQENAKLDFLASALNSGRSARFAENIKTKKGLVTEIEFDFQPFAMGGFLQVYFETELDSLLPALEAVVEELNQIAEKPLSLDELNRARALAGSSFLRTQETSGSLATLLSNFEIYFKDYRIRDAYLPQLGRLTPGDLTAEAQKYLTLDNMTLSFMLPAAAPDLDEKAIERIVGRLNLNVGEVSRKEDGGFEERTLSNGVKLIAKRDASLPMIYVRAAAMGGSLAEEPNQEGLANLTTNVMTLASQNKDSAELSRFVEGLGGAIVPSNGRNSMGLTSSFMSVNWEEALTTISDVLKKPAFSEDNLKEIKAETLANLALKEEQLSNKAFRLMRQALYPNHPYGQEVDGRPETVAAFQREDLVKFHSALYGPDQLYLLVAGDIVPEEVAKSLETLFADWPESRVPKKKVVVPPPPAPLTGRNATSLTVDSAQTHLALAFFAPPMGHPDSAALNVLESHLSGMGGLLFNELRNKRSLAYTVFSMYQSGLNSSYNAMYIATDPQKSAEAVSGLLEIIELVRTQPLTDEEVGQAISYFVGQKKVNSQRLSSRSEEALLNSLYGLGLDYAEEQIKRVEAVTAADVLRVAQTYFTPETSVLAVVGNEASIAAAREAYLNQPAKP
jgi:zinc protease